MIFRGVVKEGHSEGSELFYVIQISGPHVMANPQPQKLQPANRDDRSALHCVASPRIYAVGRENYRAAG